MVLLGFARDLCRNRAQKPSDMSNTLTHIHMSYTHNYICICISESTPVHSSVFSYVRLLFLGLFDCFMLAKFVEEAA